MQDTIMKKGQLTLQNKSVQNQVKFIHHYLE